MHIESELTNIYAGRGPFIIIDIQQSVIMSKLLLISRSSCPPQRIALCKNGSLYNTD